MKKSLPSWSSCKTATVRKLACPNVISSLRWKNDRRSSKSLPKKKIGGYLTAQSAAYTERTSMTVLIASPASVAIFGSTPGATASKRQMQNEMTFTSFVPTVRERKRMRRSQRYDH